jgi:hypothetical protein
MAANPSPSRERRPAIWPWLLMPAAVLAVFFALNRVHHQQRGSAAPPAAVPGEGGTPRQL